MHMLLRTMSSMHRNLKPVLFVQLLIVALSHAATFMDPTSYLHSGQNYGELDQNIRKINYRGVPQLMGDMSYGTGYNYMNTAPRNINNRVPQLMGYNYGQQAYGTPHDNMDTNNRHVQNDMRLNSYGTLRNRAYGGERHVRQQISRGPAASNHQREASRLSVSPYMFDQWPRLPGQVHQFHGSNWAHLARGDTSSRLGPSDESVTNNDVIAEDTAATDTIDTDAGNDPVVSTSDGCLPWEILCNWKLGSSLVFNHALQAFVWRKVGDEADDEKSIDPRIVESSFNLANLKKLNEKANSPGVVNAVGTTVELSGEGEDDAGNSFVAREVSNVSPSVLGAMMVPMSNQQDGQIGYIAPPRFTLAANVKPELYPNQVANMNTGFNANLGLNTNAELNTDPLIELSYNLGLSDAIGFNIKSGSSLINSGSNVNPGLTLNEPTVAAPAVIGIDEAYCNPRDLSCSYEQRVRGIRKMFLDNYSPMAKFNVPMQ